MREYHKKKKEKKKKKRSREADQIEKLICVIMES